MREGSFSAAALALRVPKSTLSKRVADLESHLQFARVHRDIVLRFGRFPHRNAALGRRSTGEETAFLVDGPRFGQ